MRKVVVVSGLKSATKPPDEDIPYGYRKAESIAVHRLYCLVILSLGRHCSMSCVRLVLLGALLLPTTLRAQANLPDVPEANPARPTVSTPATLTQVGYLQFEDGGLYATDSPEFSKRLGINQVYKLTLDKRAELLTLFELFTHSTGAAVSGNRPGEVFAGVQAVKTTPITERINTQFRVEMFNLFNHLNLAKPGPEQLGNDAFGTSSFGQIGSTIGAGNYAPGIGPGEPFNVQLALKIIF
jgi:hypothetical protein